MLPRKGWRAGTARWLLGALLIAASLTAAASRTDGPTAGMSAVLLGGGPSPEHNQIAIESNVRYVLRLLPSDAVQSVLFADGNRDGKTVLYEQKAADQPAPRHLMDMVMTGMPGAYEAAERYRAPSVSRLDGGIKKEDIKRAFARLKSDSRNGPILLYFTGHGSPDGTEELQNNAYDLWDGKLTVTDLASQIAALPPSRPITLVMVQCFSGAFGNLLFQDGNPEGQLADRDIAGFFATVKERMAAGCTPAVDESEYRDFTGYFFAALSGHDRVGRPVTGADYNHDGVVTMDEAFCYSLGHDTSIDVPVCTCEVFLRRFVKLPDQAVFGTPYADLQKWATPGQRAALDDLSAALGIAGEDRASAANTRLEKSDSASEARDRALHEAARAFRADVANARRALLERWPALAKPDTAAGKSARAEAEAAFAKGHTGFDAQGLLKDEKAVATAEDAAYRNELQEAKLLRFVRLTKSIVLAHTLQSGDDESLKRRFARIASLEARPLLPPQQTAMVR